MKSQLFERLPTRREIFKLKSDLSGKIPRNFNLTDLRTKLKIILPVLLFVIIIGVVLFWAKNVVFDGPATGQKTALKNARATADLNEEILLPIQDDSGKKLTEIKYAIKTAELRDEIVVGGKKATTVQGREFLILTVEITNNFDKPIQINTRDFIRVSINGDDNKWAAPEIYSDPVDVRPGSTKTTRLGLTLNTTDQNLRLRLGEVNGEKKIVPIPF